MLIEDQSTKYLNCKQHLTWLSHVKRYTQPEAIHEFVGLIDGTDCERPKLIIRLGIFVLRTVL
jgi:hypothetical protein